MCNVSNCFCVMRSNIYHVYYQSSIQDNVLCGISITPILLPTLFMYCLREHLQINNDLDTGQEQVLDQGED
jgi:hypothetical protein